MSTAQVPTPIGRDLDGRYRIEAEIGVGGLGAVYRGTHARLGKPVAIKLLHAELGGQPLLLARFEREAKALAALNHPGIVAVTDYGVDEGTPYLVMELLEGQTLAQDLARGPTDPARVAKLAGELLRALAFVHSHGLVHRDVKPGNVFLQRAADGSERLKLLDFGLAKFTDRASAPSDATLTQSGQMLGTPAYMAPEQAVGDATDARSDVYATGAILFQMLTGRLPFLGDPVEQLRGHIAEPTPSLADANPGRRWRSELDAVVQRAMAKRPQDRFTDAGELLRTLEAIPQPWLTHVDDSIATDRTMLAAHTPAGAITPVTVAQTLDAPPVRRSRGFFGWIGWLVGRVLAFGFKLTLTLLLVAAAIVAGVVYLNRDQHVKPEDVRALRDGMVPKLEQLQDDAKTFAAKASAATQESLKATRQTLAVVREGMQLPAAGGAPSAPVPSAGMPGAVAQPTAAAPAPNTAAPAPRPSARNPWARPMPKQLKTLRKALSKGEVGSERTINVLRQYNQVHGDDVRGHLLLARLYMNREWRADALKQLALVAQLDPAARGAPEMLPMLIGFVTHGAVATEASALIARTYGNEALAAIDRAMLQPSGDAAALQRLTALRAQVAALP